jgi:hypothetical protein
MDFLQNNIGAGIVIDDVPLYLVGQMPGSFTLFPDGDDVTGIGNTANFTRKDIHKRQYYTAMQKAIASMPQYSGNIPDISVNNPAPVSVYTAPSVGTFRWWGQVGTVFVNGVTVKTGGWGNNDQNSEVIELMTGDVVTANHTSPASMAYYFLPNVYPTP